MVFRESLVGIVGVALAALWTGPAWATLGGPSYVTIVCYDRERQLLHWVEDGDDGSGDAPEVRTLACRGRSATPELAFDPSSVLAQAFYECAVQRFETLNPLRVTMHAQPRVCVLASKADSVYFGSPPGVSRRVATIEVRSGRYAGRSRITTFMHHDVRVRAVYDVPGDRLRVAIVRGIGRGYEMGYEVDTVIPLWPAERNVAD
jgi:hypothetical protein